MWRFKGGRYVPHERNFGLKTVERGDIDSGNVLYHSSHANLAQWGTTRCGDFRTIDALTKKLEVRWLNRTVVGVNPLRQNEMGHGQRADVLGKLTVVITSSTAEGFRPHWLRLSVAQYLSPEYSGLVRKVRPRVARTRTLTLTLTLTRTLTRTRTLTLTPSRIACAPHCAPSRRQGPAPRRRARS